MSQDSTSPRQVRLHKITQNAEGRVSDVTIYAVDAELGCFPTPREIVTHGIVIRTSYPQTFNKARKAAVARGLTVVKD